MHRLGQDEEEVGRSLIGQIIVMNTDKSARNRGFGSRLLTLALEAFRIRGYKSVIGVTLTRRSREYQSVPLNDYLEIKGDDGRSIDQVVRFHQKHGAKILKFVDGFRPGDVDNENRGILIEYQFHV